MQEHISNPSPRPLCLSPLCTQSGSHFLLSFESSTFKSTEQPFFTASKPTRSFCYGNFHPHPYLSKTKINSSTSRILQLAHNHHHGHTTSETCTGTMSSNWSSSKTSSSSLTCTSIMRPHPTPATCAKPPLLWCQPSVSATPGLVLGPGVAELSSQLQPPSGTLSPKIFQKAPLLN